MRLILMKRIKRIHSLLAGISLLMFAANYIFAAEIKFYNGQRMTALIEGCTDEGKLIIYKTSGEKALVALTNATSIYFSGRPDYFVRSGDQKLIFNAGGHICAAIDELQNGDVLKVRSQSLGHLDIPVKFLHGIVALAVEGRAARLAEDLMRPDGIPPDEDHRYLDHIMDRRGVPYAGVIERFTPQVFEFEHEETLQRVRIDTYKFAGLRLAEVTKHKSPPLNPLSEVWLAVRCRDASYLMGRLVRITPLRWDIRPNFDPERIIQIPSSEITRVDVYGGYAVFLAQLEPVRVEERTILAPPQPFRKNENAHGEPMDIGGFIYHGGIGVHALSRITYKIDGKFRRFLADVGIDGRLEKDGSVVFRVFGDGKEIYKSPLVTGRISGGGIPIDISVEGVQELTLEVNPTADLDQADLANWGAARLLR